MGGRITVRKPVEAAPVCASGNVGRAGGLNKGVNKGKAPMRRRRGMYICRMGLDQENWCRIREPELRIGGEGERLGKLEERDREIIMTAEKTRTEGRLRSGIGTGKG